MSEWGSQVGVARARSAAALGPAPVLDVAIVRAALAEVMDPELPVLSVVDLGIVHRVSATRDGIEVSILPTFVGCPALDVIRASIAARLAIFGVPVRVEPTFEIPWTSDRITLAGRAALAAVGIAPPGREEDMRCPMCASAAVVRDGLFGPTQCRSLYYCRSCRQPFEAIKSV